MKDLASFRVSKRPALSSAKLLESDHVRLRPGFTHMASQISPVSLFQIVDSGFTHLVSRGTKPREIQSRVRLNGGFPDASSPHLGYPLHSTWDFPTWWCLSPTWTQSFPPSRLITATHWSSPGLKAPAFRKVRASCNSNNRPPMRAAICFEASQVKLQPSLCHTGPGLAADSEAIHSSVRANGGFPETSSPHLGYPPHWSQWDFPTRWILFPTCSQSRPPLRPSFRSTATHWSSPGQMGPWCFRNSLPSWHEEESVGCASDSS